MAGIAFAAQAINRAHSRRFV